MNKEKIKENFNKNKILLLVFSLLWIVCVVLTLINYNTTLGKRSDGNYDKDVAVEIDNNTIISQSFMVEDGTEAISVNLVTYARKNSGILNFTVTNYNGSVIYANKDVDCSNIQDRSFYTVELNQKIKAQIINVILSSNSQHDTAVGAYYSYDNELQSSVFKINNEYVEGGLCVRYLMNDDKLTFFSNTTLTLVIAALSLLFIWLLLFEPKYEVFFATFVFVLGMIFMFIITPLAVPDEMGHYQRTLLVSNKIMLSDATTVDETYVSYDSFHGYKNSQDAYRRVVDELFGPADVNKMQIDIHDPYNMYKICYVPQAIGVSIARALNLNVLLAFYLGRMFGLMFYTLCIYLSIRKTPIHKVLFGILASMPMFIQQAASFSYDGFIFALSFITISYLLKWIFIDEQITYKELAVVTIGSWMLAPAKIVYSVFAFLYFFVPTNRFGSKRNKIIACLLINLMGIKEIYNGIYHRIAIHIYRLFGWAASAETNLVNNSIPTPNNDPYTFTYVLQHPMETIRLFLYTIRYSIKLWFYGAIGRTMCALNLILPLPIVHALPILLFITAFRKEDYVESIPLKLAFVFLAGCAGLMTLFGMLVGWTNTDSEMIEGIQGRYFSPLLPYFFTIFNNKKLSLPKKFDKYLIFAQILLMFEVIVYILSYTFVN